MKNIFTINVCNFACDVIETVEELEQYINNDEEKKLEEMFSNYPDFDIFCIQSCTGENGYDINEGGLKDTVILDERSFVNKWDVDIYCNSAYVFAKKVDKEKFRNIHGECFKFVYDNNRLPYTRVKIVRC